MQREEVSSAQLHAIIGNFIARLGYANIEEAQRPASRVQKGAAIFRRNAAFDNVASNKSLTNSLFTRRHAMSMTGLLRFRIPRQ